MESSIPLKSKEKITNDKEGYNRDWKNWKLLRQEKKESGNINKSGRIVIRNLPYQAQEVNLTKFFSPYGKILEITFLKFENGRKKGVAFLQYDNLLSAMKAIKEANMKKLMGRPIAVDLAVSKDRYRSAGVSLEKREDPDNDIEIKDEDLSSNSKKKAESTGLIPSDKIKKEEDGGKTKTEMMETGSADVSVKEEGMSEDDESDDKGSEVDDDSDVVDDDDDDESEIDDEDDDIKDYSSEDESNTKSAIKMKKEKSEPTFSHNPVSKDVQERRTVFMRNLSFDAAEQDVEDILSQFGQLKYVVFCRDKLTQRFRGTAFAQFLDKNACENCLEAFDDPARKIIFRLGGRFFNVFPAIGREDISKQHEAQKEKKEPKDKRNLYLAREGVIREGTQPAFGASKSDLAQRIIREKIKRKMLANFNIFMSPTRLYICNLPLELTDKELKNIIKKYSPKDTVIKECRIMKNLFQCDEQGNPVSKGHGFVAFTEHSHALQALRTINNNPEIFTRDKRPIVEFSMENKAALKAKEMRIQKSKIGNKKNEKENSLKQQKPNSGHKGIDPLNSENKFMGAKYDPKKKGMKAFHTHIGPKVRHRDMNKKAAGKITRNKVNNQFRSTQIAKRKKNQKTHNKSNKSNKISKKKNSKTKDTKKAKKKKFI